MTNAKRDENRIPVILGTSSVDGVTPVPPYVDPTTHRLLVDLSGGGGGHTIQDEGTPLTARANLNFVGAGVTATDDAGNDATVITIPQQDLSSYALTANVHNVISGGTTNQVLAKNSNSDYDLKWADAGGGGGGGITDITYADLITAIGGSTLLKGSFYRITDFATKHYIVDGGGTQITHIITGATEPLIVLAISANTIGKEAKSEAYPQDKIYYDWNSANWTDDIGFATVAAAGQIDIITLTGTSGTATITLAGGLTKTVTFNTDLATTASDFVTAFAADYLAQEIVITSKENTLIFTANIAGTGFTSPAISNATGDLAGTADNYAINVAGAGIIAGFTGVIYFRHDTLLDNYMGYDFRNVKFRRWKTNVPTWDVATAYFAGDYINYSGYIYRALSAQTGNTPANGSSYWVQLLDLSLTEYWNSKSDLTNSIISSVVYDDFKTFVEAGGTATYDLSVRSNHFEIFKDNQTYYETIGTILANNVFFLFDDEYFMVYSNKFGAECSSNTFAGYFYSNTIANYFSSNTIGYFNSNTIANNFSSNIIGYFYSNTIANNFSSNTIGYFNSNTIANYFRSNIIGYFYSNTIANYFRSNIIGNGFTMNVAEDNLNNNGSIAIDFTSATYVYGSYNKTLYIRPDGTQKLRYYDDTNSLIIVDANA